jgi:hypothetical protein
MPFILTGSHHIGCFHGNTQSMTLTLPLHSLFTVSRLPAPGASFLVSQRRRNARWRTTPVEMASSAAAGTCWAVPEPEVGDSPQLYHPLYTMAVLSAGPVAPHSLIGSKSSLRSWPMPRVNWTTDEDVRRSMTLNGMRMSTEYWQNGSTRVLQLVESRLREGQRDIVHDVLVYLMRQVLDTRASAREARNLRAESVAAFLGLRESAVRGLFAQERLSVPLLHRAIESGVAGPVRRAIDAPTMLRNQLEQLRHQLNEYSQQEERWQWLIDEVVSRLYTAA